MKKIQATITMECTEAMIAEHGEPGETIETWEQMLKEMSRTMQDEAPKGMTCSMTVEVVDA